MHGEWVRVRLQLFLGDHLGPFLKRRGLATFPRVVAGGSVRGLATFPHVVAGGSVWKNRRLRQAGR